MHTVLRKVTREGILLLLFFLPQHKKIILERWLRGHEEFCRLSKADCVVVSFGKSGRTWLRVMLSRFFQVKHKLSLRNPLRFDNLHHKNPEIPKIFFTHDNYIKDYTKNRDSKADFYDKKVILLVRNPQDVAVSQFFQWKYRMRPAKKRLNSYPSHGKDVSVFDFVINADSGLPKIIEFLNEWAREISEIRDILVIRYEDMRAHPGQTLRQILAFMGTPGSDEQIREAVAFASYENMKKLEEKGTFWLSGRRLLPSDRKNPDSYKVRRAKVGGYRDYFTDEQIAEIDKLVSSTLSPFYGYGDRGTDQTTNERALTGS